MRLPFPLLALALLAAGCVSSADVPLDADAAGNATVVFAEDYAFENTTIPKQDLQNATLGEEHTHDAWGGFEELVLLDETREAGLCEGPVDATFYLFVSGGAFGCVQAFLPEGVVVPEGAAQLRVEVDATDALKNGEMQFQFRNKAREEVLESSAEPQHTWLLPLTQDDWDIPHAPATTFIMYVGAASTGSVFEGPVKIRIVAEKIEGWQPVLAVAHVDHWMLPQLHDFVAPGVMRLLEGEGSVTNIDPARFTSPTQTETTHFEDIVAPGASYVTVVADTTSSDCAPVIRCWYVPELQVGGYERTQFGTLLHEDGGRRVYVWKVPDEVPFDSVYADQSTTGVNGRIDACAAGDAGGPSCGTASMVSDTATARLLVHAWKGEVDLALLNELAGPAPS